MEKTETTVEKSDKASINKELTDKVYSLLLDWYKSAESKAQIILGILSSLIFFIFGVLLLKPNDIKATLQEFDGIMFAILIIVCISVVIILIALFSCLYSRVEPYTPDKDKSLYATEYILWFGHNAYHNADKLRDTLMSVTEETYIHSFANQIVVLSGNVRKKHKMVNIAFISACFGLTSLLFGLVYYIYLLV